MRVLSSRRFNVYEFDFCLHTRPFVNPYFQGFFASTSSCLNHHIPNLLHHIRMGHILLRRQDRILRELMLLLHTLRLARTHPRMQPAVTAARLGGHIRMATFLHNLGHPHPPLRDRPPPIPPPALASGRPPLPQQARPPRRRRRSNSTTLPQPRRLHIRRTPLLGLGPLLEVDAERTRRTLKDCS